MDCPITAQEFHGDKGLSLLDLRPMAPWPLKRHYIAMGIDPNLIMGLYSLGSVILATHIARRKTRVSKDRSASHERYWRLIEESDRQLRIDPSNALAVLRKGEMYEAMGNTKQALRLYGAAHAMCPRIYTIGDYREAFNRVAGSGSGDGFPLQARHSGSR